MSTMVDRLILVNGLPGSGKSTLAAELAVRLPAPVVSRDAVEKLLADAFPAVPPVSLGPVATETAWGIVAETPGTVLFESSWFGPRDLPLVKAGLERCCAAMVIEIWCDVPPDVARRRSAARARQAGHPDGAAPRWAAPAEPLDVGLTFRVRTDGPVDVGAVAAGISHVAGGYEF